METKPTLSWTFLFFVISFGITTFGTDMLLAVDVGVTSPARFPAGANLAWKFDVSKKTDVNGVEVPEADVQLVVNSKVFRVGKFVGYPVVIKDLKRARIPKEAILACKTWFGGEGDEIYVRSKDEVTLEVLSRHIDEGDATLLPPHKIMEIRY